MNDVFYNLNASRILKDDILGQILASMNADPLCVLARTTKYELNDMHHIFGDNNLDGMNSYITTAFILAGRATQHSAELVIFNHELKSGNYFEQFCFNFSNYSLIDYTALVAQAKLTDINWYRDVIYRHFYSLIKENNLCPFKSTSEFFEYISSSLCGYCVSAH